MKSTAKKDGDDYIINANKLWITNSEHAGLFLVFANATPEKMGQKDVSAFCFPIQQDENIISEGSTIISLCSVKLVPSTNVAMKI